MLEFNQSDCSSSGFFDSPGPSLVGFFIFFMETVQVVIRSAKWNYNPENSFGSVAAPTGEKRKKRRSLQYFITFNVTFLLSSQVTDLSCF